MVLNQAKESLKFSKFHIRSKESGILYEIPTGQVYSFNLYEAIDFPGITGSIAFRDTANFKENTDVFALDEFEILFGREHETELLLKMVIMESGGDHYSDEDDVGNLIQFKFCSPWLIDGMTKKRSRSFRNKRIDEIVEILLLEAGADIGNITQTGQTLDRYVTPYMPPIIAINHLMDIATDVNGNGGYLLWTDMISGHVNFTPIGELISADNIISEFNLRTRPKNENYKGTYYDLILSQEYDVMKYGQLGMANTRLVGFNYDRTELMNTTPTIDEYNDNHLSTMLPLNEEFLGRQYRTTKDSFRFPHTSGLIRLATDAANHMDGQLATMYSNWTSDAVEIKVKARGEVSVKRAGKLIKLEYPKSERTKENELHSGRYLIKKIRHHFGEGEFGQIVTLISDGYKKIDRGDLISWQNAGTVNQIEDEIDRFDVDSPDEFISKTAQELRDEVTD